MAENFQPQFMLSVSIGVVQDEGEGSERLSAEFIETVRFVLPSGGGFAGDWIASSITDSHKFLYSKEYEAFQKMKPQLMRSVTHLKVIANPIIWNYLQKQGANTLEEANALLEPNAFKKYEAEYVEKASRAELNATYQNLRCVKKICEDLLRQIEREEKQRKEEAQKETKSTKEIKL